MGIELKEETVQGRPRARLEVSGEIYDEITSNLSAALADAKALRQGIPCFLSAPTVVAESLEKHLARLQGAIGSIDIVREAGQVCPLCQERFTEPAVAGLCPACARDRGVTG